MLNDLNNLATYKKLLAKFEQGELSDLEYQKFMELVAANPLLEENLASSMLQSLEDESSSDPQPTGILIDLQSHRPYRKQRTPGQRIELPKVASSSLTQNPCDTWVYEELDEYYFRVEVNYLPESDETHFIASIHKGNLDITDSTEITLSNEQGDEIELLRKGEKIFKQKGLTGLTYRIRFQHKLYGLVKEFHFQYLKGKSDGTQL